MPKNANTLEQIINERREAETMLNQGSMSTVICKNIGVTKPTHYR